MIAGRDALLSVQAKVKHMIVLTDGQTSGTNYGQLAAGLQQQGITVSTVGVGQGAALDLLQQIAAAGGGQFYATLDPTNLPQIFTQDAMTHMGRLIREEPFEPSQTERHAMVEGWPVRSAPPLLGYVKTRRKATAQVPLVTPEGDPLLASWRFGAGRVVAFTSDCKSRWGALWISSWREGYNQFWAQVLREMARPPQGQLMDLALRREAGAVTVTADVLEDAATFADAADVEATVYFVAATSLASELRPVERLTLRQTGAGRYEASFYPQQPGVYLVQSRAGSRTVSAGIVQPTSAESATGQVNEAGLREVTHLTGGELLPPEVATLPPDRRPGPTTYTELRPLLLVLLLLVFLSDLLIRRWENVIGVREAVRERFAGTAQAT